MMFASRNSQPGVARVLLCALAVACLAPSALHAAAQIEGKVVNGTTGKPVAHQAVLLLVPREGMQPAVKAETNASGHFVLSDPSIDRNGFYLIEASYQSSKYNAPVKFGSADTATADLTVYDSTTSSAALRVQLLRVLVRAEGDKARVRKEYAIENSSQPPRAFDDPKGTVHFQVSPGAPAPQVSVTGLMNMPLPQSAEQGKTPGDYFVKYPLKPGTTTVTVEYLADYSSNALEIGDKLPFPITQAEIYVSPASLSVDSKQLRADGVDRASGIARYDAQNLAAGTLLEARVSGEAISGGRLPQQGTESAEGQVKILPNSLDRVGLPLLACFLLVSLWALGVRLSKEWPAWKQGQAASPAEKQKSAKLNALLNSVADLDELFAAGKIAEKDYWKERLELKAKIVALRKKAPTAPASSEPYANRPSHR